MPQQEQFQGQIDSALCLDFANTVNAHASDHPRDNLKGYEDLVTWARGRGILSAQKALQLQDAARRRPREAQNALNRAVDLREAIYRLFTQRAAGAPADTGAIAILNSALAEAALTWRVAAEKEQFTLNWDLPDGEFFALCAPIAWSAATLLAAEQLIWVKQCASEGCGWLFIDTTKNHSRRWCDMSECGSRAKARRYYHRKVAGSSEQN